MDGLKILEWVKEQTSSHTRQPEHWEGNLPSWRITLFLAISFFLVMALP
jgi:hypothetical protein